MPRKHNSLRTSREKYLSPELSIPVGEIAKIKIGKKHIKVTMRCGDTFKLIAPPTQNVLLHFSNLFGMSFDIKPGSSTSKYGGSFFSRSSNNCPPALNEDEDEDEDSDPANDEEDWSEDGDDEFPIVSPEQKKVPIDQIGLTHHVTQLLLGAGIKTLGDFYPRSRDLFLEVRGIGLATLDKLNAHLISRGYPAFYR